MWLCDCSSSPSLALSPLLPSPSCSPGPTAHQVLPALCCQRLSAGELLAPPGHLFTSHQYFQASGLSSAFLAMEVGPSARHGDSVPWRVPLLLPGVLRFSLLCHCYGPSTPEMFSAIAPGWAKAPSWGIRLSSHVIVVCLSVGSCVVLGHKLSGLGALSTCSVPVFCSTCV